MVNRTLVVARFEEDIDWIAELPADWDARIVQKGEHTPNTGREAGSYVWAILDLYRRLGDHDLVAFVQGDPFDHCPDLNHRLSLQVRSFRWLGHAAYRSGPSGQPHHMGLPVRDTYESLLGQPFPGYVDFAPGGQFVATGRAIRRRERVFWEDLYGQAQKDPMPWVLERLWEAILTSV